MPPQSCQEQKTKPSLNKPRIYLAPLHGITDAGLRNIMVKNFGGIDKAVAPFIAPQKNIIHPEKLLADVIPEKNKAISIIPQLLHTEPEPFLILAERLAGMGYQEINWNLGCPVAKVAKKKRGSGLLPYPEKILSFLDRVIPKLPLALSIKTRLGYYEPEELLALLPQLNNYPLKEIILHPRLGKDLYRGLASAEAFLQCQRLSCHELVYNGDIATSADYSRIKKLLPDTTRFMVGRGLLASPFLAEELKNGKPVDPATKRQRLYTYHQDLYTHYQSTLSGPGHLLGRMKLIWSYFIDSFPGQQKTLKAIKKARSLPQYNDEVSTLFAENEKHHPRG